MRISRVDRQATNLNSWIMSPLFWIRNFTVNFISYFLIVFLKFHRIIQQTEICNNRIIVIQQISNRQKFFLVVFSFVPQKVIQIIIRTNKIIKIRILGQSSKP